MSVFRFKQFSIKQDRTAMKVGTDSMLLGSFIEVVNHRKALDIGTGTGVLSLMLAQENHGLEIKALEIDADASEQAAENVANSVFSKQIEVIHGNFLTHSFIDQFDLILSNPPFFENSSKSMNEQKNTARHNDSLPMQALIEKISELLVEEGIFWIILPQLNFDVFAQLMQEKQFFLNREISIFGKPEQLIRKIGAFSWRNTSAITEDFIIRNPDGTYTDQYRNLTEKFHASKI